MKLNISIIIKRLHLPLLHKLINKDNLLNWSICNKENQFKMSNGSPDLLKTNTQNGKVYPILILSRLFKVDK